MDNFRRLLPHTKKESKMDKRDKLFAINEVCRKSTEELVCGVSPGVGSGN
jgi:hypothetical protein